MRRKEEYKHIFTIKYFVPLCFLRVLRVKVPKKKTEDVSKTSIIPLCSLILSGITSKNDSDKKLVVLHYCIPLFTTKRVHVSCRCSGGNESIWLSKVWAHRWVVKSQHFGEQGASWSWGERAGRKPLKEHNLFQS